MTLTERLIELIESKSIDEDDINAASWFVLDAMANIAAGRKTKQGKILTRWFLDEPSNTSRKVLLLGGLMHILEVDDLHRRSVVHPGCVVIPTVLSLGIRDGLSGRKMLEAVLKGFEACTRLGNSVGPAHYKIWHNTATCGTFGAAYAAGSLLGLSKGQLCDALGNAGTQSSGLWEFSASSSMSKHLHAGRAGQSGLLASELSQYGLSGSATILEGKRGFYAACCPDAIPERLLINPEDKWQLHHTSIKPWPCCRHTHPAIDAALELSNNLNAGNIESIELSVTQAALDVCDKPNPETLYDAKFSLQHCVSIALLCGRVVFDSFEDEALQKSSGLANKFRLKCSKEFENAYPDSWGAKVKVKLKNRKEYSVSRKHAKGDPEAQLSSKEIREKAEMLFHYGEVLDGESWVEHILRFSRKPFLRESDLNCLLNFS